MAPIIGRAHIAYLPERRVVGISKVARLVQVFTKRCRSRKE
jgi:GTP cyclohydrolase I